jgi:hypothetical protein
LGNSSQYHHVSKCPSYQNHAGPYCTTA